MGLSDRSLHPVCPGECLARHGDGFSFWGANRHDHERRRLPLDVWILAARGGRLLRKRDRPTSQNAGAGVLADHGSTPIRPTSTPTRQTLSTGGVCRALVDAGYLRCNHPHGARPDSIACDNQGGTWSDGVRGRGGADHVCRHGL